MKMSEAKSVRKPIDFSAVWDSSDVDFRFEIKAQELAVDLVNALIHSGKTQAELAEKLDWKPSRVSKLLSGSSNITIKTLFVLLDALDLDFDVVFRKPNQEKPLQPWQKSSYVEYSSKIIRNINELHEKACANLNKSEVILQTAVSLNRKAWADFIGAKQQATKSSKPRTENTVEYFMLAS
ncbi:Helix-turn-helix [Klebsiella pneumoniae]|uniref:helix-turn-helix domain-containing protein n=2 Tax=Klebsiella/Raoultella group TaxID=2890311 RepID=UPI000936ED90|nr:helix-turn-helix transcriptional regulator [Klebsiella pneumoniae]HDE1980549.1 helix-turn-helix transcriptional regulator [Klebsiella quasipneumoniae]EIW8789944.1 helix-turn-helix transcriptional regulator [Klebsiella pneumoniae]MBD7169289.1 helix-turn-helix transcriptional regulator [Klebsiella pneumoniae]MDZ0129540.1 helix-turn-helix domain-containing protein [Klebsiella pneumoniae]RNQ34998.1 XRE family transcriptional regulator [Klebsiella pneumoniae]